MHRRLLTHYLAFDMTLEIVGVFAGCLREEELHEAFIEVFTRLKAGLEDYQVRTNRFEQRMRPGLN
jgi:hypothetical protein